MNQVIRCTCLCVCPSYGSSLSMCVIFVFCILTTYRCVMYFQYSCGWGVSGPFREENLGSHIQLYCDLYRRWILYLCFFHIGAIYYVVILVTLFQLFYCLAVCEGLNHKEISYPQRHHNVPEQLKHILCCTVGIHVPFDWSSGLWCFVVL